VQHRLGDLAVLHAALQLLLLLVVDVELVLQVVDVLLVIVPGNPRAPFDRTFKQQYVSNVVGRSVGRSISGSPAMEGKKSISG